MLIVITCSTNAKAEDQDYTTTTQDQSATKPANDQQYKMPNYYNGKYFPDDESVIGYHGTTNSASAQDQNQKIVDGNGYYYYYY